MSISTKVGDGGLTHLLGSRRVSKADQQIEVVGCLDELGAHLGFARSICGHEETGKYLKTIQQQLFAISEVAVSDCSDGAASPRIDRAWIEDLTHKVNHIEQADGVLLDWALTGEVSAAAALDIARTVCRRTERATVRCVDAGTAIDRDIIRYLNRLADLLWLLARVLEREAGADARLRGPDSAPVRWSRAW